MTLFDRQEDRLVAYAVDDLRRPVEIRRWRRRRDGLFWLMLALTALFIWNTRSAGLHHDSSIAFFLVIIVWMMLAKCQSDLLLLKLVEALRAKNH